jgi:hypothetical protein
MRISSRVSMSGSTYTESRPCLSLCCSCRPSERPRIFAHDNRAEEGTGYDVMDRNAGRGKSSRVFLRTQRSSGSLSATTTSSRRTEWQEEKGRECWAEDDGRRNCGSEEETHEGRRDFGQHQSAQREPHCFSDRPRANQLFSRRPPYEGKHWLTNTPRNCRPANPRTRTRRRRSGIGIRCWASVAR